MKEINSSYELKAEILQLGKLQAEQEIILKYQFDKAYASLKPINIFKKSIREAISSDEEEGGIIDYIANFTADFASNQIMKGSSNSNIKKFLSPLIHCGIVTIIKQNSDVIKAFAESLINVFFKEKEEPDSE